MGTDYSKISEIFFDITIVIFFMTFLPTFVVHFYKELIHRIS